MVTGEKRNEFTEKLNSVSASTRDKTIYRTRFGLEDGILKSNGETAKIFRMNRESIRLIVTKIVEEIGSPVEE